MPFRSRLNEVETMPSSNSIFEISNFCSNPDILMCPSKLLIFSSSLCSKPFQTDIDIIKANEPNPIPMIEIFFVILPMSFSEKKNCFAI